METLPETQADADIERQIAQALKKRGGKATLADVVVDTGLPQLEAERLLRKMIGKYACHLEVTEDGDILYEFDPAMRRLDAKERSQERWRAIGAKVWAAFSVFMKALIAIVMVLYVVLFVVLIVAAMVAAARGGSDNRRSSSRRGGGGGGLWFWYLVFGRSNDPYRRHTRHNPRYARWGRAGSAGDKDERPFYMKVFSFVLGPDKGDVEPLGDERTLLALVRERGGAVAPAEVSAHTGWSLPRSEQALTRMVGRFEGNIAIDEEDGRLVFTFASLLRTAGAGGRGEKVPLFWDRREQKLPLTGNAKGSNILIGSLNTFNLVASAAAPSMILPQLGMAGNEAAMIGIHYFPLAFSGLLFLMPVLRWVFHVRPENARRAGRNVRRTVYRAVFESVQAGQIWLPSERIAERALAARSDEAVNGGALVQQIDRIVPDLGGDLLSPEGEEITDQLGWRFDPLADDLKAAKKIRRDLEREDTPVKVAFSTKTVEAEQEAPA